MAQLRCSDVTLGYEGTAVMEHLSFSVSAGDYLYIVGENGSGKSTLMKAILGLKSPMAGKIETGDGLKPTRSAICHSRLQYSVTFRHRCWRSSGRAV